jgi:hypothetical protein
VVEKKSKKKRINKTPIPKFPIGVTRVRYPFPLLALSSVVSQTKQKCSMKKETTVV